jgi:hypothetical protein
MLLLQMTVVVMGMERRNTTIDGGDREYEDADNTVVGSVVAATAN